MPGTMLIAIGGNSLIRSGERGTIKEQLANAHSNMKPLSQMAARGWRIVITHGNGPHVGAALMRSERAAAEVYEHPLDVCVATTQGEIGYLLQRALEYELGQVGLTTPVVTVQTRVRVEENDPALQERTKPIGPVYQEEEARRRQERDGWQMIEIPGRGFRRVVASPEPAEVIDSDVIRQLLGLGMIVIAVGGGGIPVVEKPDHRLFGLEAVIDKDPASVLLATDLGAEILVISTNADRVYLDFGKPTQRALGRVTSEEMRRHQKEGQFPPGSMGPKVESALRFLHGGGKRVLITSPERLPDALIGRAGTHIAPRWESTMEGAGDAGTAPPIQDPVK